MSVQPEFVEEMISKIDQSFRDALLKIIKEEADKGLIDFDETVKWLDDILDLADRDR